MNEYWTPSPNDNEVDLKAAPLPLEAYRTAHEGLVISCHDVVIFQNQAALLIRRRSHPARDILWPIGGRLLRGMATEDSLRQRVLRETQLELDQVRFLGVARTFFPTEPFGHGKGTDTLNLMYVAKGLGELNLDDMHEQPIWVTDEDYTAHFQASLHPYTREIMDKAFASAKSLDLL